MGLSYSYGHREAQKIARVEAPVEKVSRMSWAHAENLWQGDWQSKWQQGCCQFQFVF